MPYIYMIRNANNPLCVNSLLGSQKKNHGKMFISVCMCVCVCYIIGAHHALLLASYWPTILQVLVNESKGDI